MPTTMEFGLLGPLLVRCGGMVLLIQRGNQRALLATLLLAANRVVPAEEIAETLWGGRAAAVGCRDHTELRQAAPAGAGGRWPDPDQQPAPQLWNPTC